MSPTLTFFVADYVRFPRVSGDEPSPVRRSTTPVGFSPRERG